MHELSFCQGIVEAVLTELAPYNQPGQSGRPGARVLAVTVVIGKLHQVVEDNLQMAYSLLTKDTPAENSELQICFVEIAYTCRRCSYRGSISLPLFLCQECGSGDLEITTGKELYLEKMEINQDEQSD